MKRPKIAVVSPDVWGSPGGIAKVAQSVAQACRSWGADVRVHALHDPPDVRAEDTVGYGGDRWRMSADVVRAGLRGDLVIFMHPNLSVLGPLFRWRSKYVVVSHGVEVWAPLGRARKAGMNAATAHWAVSANTAWYLNEVQGIDPSRVRAVKNALGPGASLPMIEPGVRVRGDYLLVVSRLHPDDAYKGVDVVIEAAERPVIIAGDGPDRARLEALAEGKDVRFLGRVDDATLNALFAGARAFVLPSAGEGFGLVYLEAMAHGLPCIAAKAGGAPEVVVDGETGVVVPPRDVDALRRAMSRVCGDEGEAMGKKGRERLEREFLFERYERDVHAALDALVNAR